MAQDIIVSPYADYEFYTTVMKRDELTQEEFEKYEIMAEDYIDGITWHRIPDMTESEMTERTALQIRKAVCMMAEQAAREDKASSEIPVGINSENNDGYSVSYLNTTKTEQQSDADSVMRGIAARYLADTGLLYRGGGAWHEN